ncbi:hypothetical protein [Kribbella swartbergensis]
MRSRSLAVVLVASGAVLGACSNQAAEQAPAPQQPVQSEPAVREAAAPQPGQPVIGPPAVRVLTVSAGTTDGLRLSVVGPGQTTYRLRIGKAITSCRQSNGPKARAALPGLPPNAVNSAVLSCSAGPTRQAVVRDGVLLVRTDVGEGFQYDYEVPVGRDL